jgi:hypothetical protein
VDGGTQCASGRVLIVRSYYRVAEPPDLQEVRLQVRLDAICLPSQDGQPSSSSARVVMGSFTVGYGADDHDERLERVREAAADYATDKLDQRLGGSRLDADLWMSKNSFPPAIAVQVMTDVNVRLNERLADTLRDAAVRAGSPGVVADVGAGMAADFALAPFAKPIRQVTRTIELAGLAVGVITCQPHLAMACAKALVHDEARTLSSRVITDAISDRARSARDRARSARDSAGRQPGAPGRPADRGPRLRPIAKDETRDDRSGRTDRGARGGPGSGRP